MSEEHAMTIVARVTDEGRNFFVSLFQDRKKVPGVDTYCISIGDIVAKADFFEEQLGRIADGERNPDEIADAALEKGNVSDFGGPREAPRSGVEETAPVAEG